MKDAEAPVPSRTNANVTGDEVSTRPLVRSNPAPRIGLDCDLNEHHLGLNPQRDSALIPQNRADQRSHDKEKRSETQRVAEKPTGNAADQRVKGEHPGGHHVEPVGHLVENSGVVFHENSPVRSASNLPAIDLADTPASHIRNVRCILELAAEYTRNGLGKKNGSVVLDREAVADIENKLGAALVLLDTTGRAAQLAAKLGFQPAGVWAVEDDPMQGALALAVPRQSAPAFAKRAGAR